MLEVPAGRQATTAKSSGITGGHRAQNAVTYATVHSPARKSQGAMFSGFGQHLPGVTASVSNGARPGVQVQQQ